jgi:hypothetical protein
VHVGRARTRPTVPRHLQRLSDAVGALEAHAAWNLWDAADEDDIVQVIESVGGPVEDRKWVRALVGVRMSFAKLALKQQMLGAA